MNPRNLVAPFALLAALSAAPDARSAPPAPAAPAAAAPNAARPHAAIEVTYSTQTVDGVRIFYREAGDRSKPTLVLLHGFPASSHQFRNLIPALADRFHLIAPDYPGFGHSDAPDPWTYSYTFDHLASSVDGLLAQLGVTRFALYVQDYGAPVGFRIATRHPDAITAIIAQNGTIHADGLSDALAPLQEYWKAPAENEAKVRGFLAAQTTKFQYTQGSPDPSKLSPDAWTFDQALLDRPGNDQIQLSLLYDYRNNVPKFAEWQAYLGARKPPLLVLWGKNDPFFLVPAAQAYLREEPKASVTLLDAGHFATEDHGAEIAAAIRAFADKTPGLAR